MKKLLLITFVLSILVNLRLDAQEKEAKTYNKFVGGSMSLSAWKGSPRYYAIDDNPLGIFNAESNIQLKLLPTYGKQINTKTIIGVKPYISMNKTIITNFTDDNGNDIRYKYLVNKFGLGVFSRHTLRTFNKFSIGIEPNLSVAIKTNKTIEEPNKNTTTVKSYQGSISLSPFVSYQLATRFRLLSYIGNASYTVNKPVENSSKSTSPFLNLNVDTDLNSNFNLNFGLSNIYFGGEFLF